MASTDDRYRSTDDRYGGHRSMTFNRYRAQALYMCIQIHMMIRLPVGTSSIRGSILPSQFDSPSFKSQQFVSRGVPTLRAQPGMPVPVMSVVPVPVMSHERSAEISTRTWLKNLNNITNITNIPGQGLGAGGVHVACSRATTKRCSSAQKLSSKNAFIFKICPIYLKISRAFGANI